MYKNNFKKIIKEKNDFLFLTEYTYLVQKLVCLLLSMVRESHVYNSIWFVTNKPVYIKSVYQCYAYFFYIYIFIFCSFFLTQDFMHDWRLNGPMR